MGRGHFSLIERDGAGGEYPLRTATVTIEEAGGQVTRFDGSAFEIDSRETLATNGLVHNALLHEFQEIFAGRGLDPLPDPRDYQRGR